MPRQLVTLVVTLALAAIALHARPSPQVGPPPPAAPPAQSPAATQPPPATGTGLIMGRVLDAGTNKPIQGALVALAAQAQPAGAGGGPPGTTIPGFAQQAAATGADGFFVFTSLPKGAFTLTASESSAPNVYATQAVALGDGEKFNDVELRILRSSVVTGQIRDEHGEGIEGITITLMRVSVIGGRRTLSVAQSAITDDRGVYRIAGVAAGDYGACALFSRRIAPVAAGVAQYSGNDDQRRTMSGSGALTTGGSGYRVGDLVLISGMSQRNVDPAPAEDGRFAVFSNACFPSASTVQGMEVFRVESGVERAQVDLVLPVVPTVRILGKLAGPANRLSGMAVNLYPALPGEVAVNGVSPFAQTITDPDGAFGFIGVPQGSYVLRVAFWGAGEPGIPMEIVSRLIEMGVTITADMFVSPQSNVPEEPTLWAASPITVGDADVTGITLSLREGARVTGSIVFEGSKERPAANRLTMAFIGFEPIDPQVSAMVARGRVAADGSFTTPGLVPGRYIIRPNYSFPGWTIKSIMAGGRNVVDDAVDLGSSDVGGVVITMTDRPTEVVGTVRNSSGQPDRRARVVAFPSDRARWTQVNAGRRAVMTSPTSQGAFSFSGLPAGDYFVAAMNEQATTNWQDPRVLEALSRTAVLVVLRDGERRSVDVVTSVVR